MLKNCVRLWNPIDVYRVSSDIWTAVNRILKYSNEYTFPKLQKNLETTPFQYAFLICPLYGFLIYKILIHYKS